MSSPRFSPSASPDRIASKTPSQQRPPSASSAQEVLSSAQLRERLARAAEHSGTELVVIDVRETLPFTESHLIFSTNFPYNRLDIEAPVRIPRLSVPIVIVDGDGALLDKAHARLRGLGYTHIALLSGGVAQWQRDGFPVYAGFNVRSKAFAEVVEHHAQTPAIDYVAFRDLPDGPPIVLDSRTRDEYHNATVPSAFHAPGADLVRVVRDLVPDENTPIVVACGGRTRSIIGAQSLIDAGVPNPVFSLRNGTGGLRLAGHAREHGAKRYAAPPSARSLDWAISAVQHAKPDVAVFTASDVAAWRADSHRTLYILDLREQQARDALPVADAAPVAGGQLVQEIDLHAPVIGARVLLVDDDDLVRATMTASWVQQIGGFDVAIAPASAASLENVAAVSNAQNAQAVPHVQAVPTAAHTWQSDANAAVPASASVTAQSLAKELQASTDDILIIDLARSPAFRNGHIAGALWALRDSWQHVWRTDGAAKRIVLTSEDGRLAALAWADWSNAHVDAGNPSDVRVLAGGTRSWADAGMPTQGVEDNGAPVHPYPDVWLGPQQRGGDVLPDVRAYLDWEIDLVHQVEHDPDFRALIRLAYTH